VGHGCPNTTHEKIMALGRAEMAERGRRDRGSDVIAKVVRSKTELRLKNDEKNFEFNSADLYGLYDAVDAFTNAAQYIKTRY